MSCEHHRDGVCSHSIAVVETGARPSLGVCARCAHYSGPSRGLGDIVAKVASTVGIKPCGGCAKRREALNLNFPRNSE